MLDFSSFQTQELKDHYKNQEADLEGQIEALKAEYLESKEHLAEECFVSAALWRAEEALIQHAARLTDDLHRFKVLWNHTSSITADWWHLLQSLLLVLSIEN